MKKKSYKKPLDESYGYSYYYNHQVKFSGKHSIIFGVIKIGCDVVYTNILFHRGKESL